MELLFIGAGKMATAIGAGIARYQLWPLDGIAAADISAPAREAFTAQTGIVCVESAAAKMATAEVVLLAVKPQVAEAAVKALPPLRPGALVISICAGITTAKLADWFGTGRVIRVMPNTPLMVGKGASAYALGPDADDAAAAIAERLLGALGVVKRVEEKQLDAVTALSGSGPAYVFELAKALAEAGEKVGLDSELALKLTVQTIAGAAEMMARKLGTPDQLRDAVTSPNGTTAAGLKVMADSDFRGMMEKVVIAARDRSIELGK